MTIGILISQSWNHSVTATKVSFENLSLRIPVQTSNHHSSKSLIRRNALESLAILVEQVDAGISRRTWLRRVRAHGPFISGKIPERWIPVSEVGASRGTVEVLTLVDVCAIAVWGRKEQEEEFSGYESHINYIKDF